ncbi:periplasmic heavy metal sensor [Myxococcus stipitatus]|uniref:periplasmic heavy metal sensor n=1 Tax=Myxococcus stipitatus TaxID=83455 RepID=UPI003145149B
MLGFLFGGACLAGLVYTVRGGRRWHHHHRGGSQWGWRMKLRWLFERLETSPGQEKVIIKATEELTESLSGLRDELTPTRTTLAQAMRGEHFDSAAVRERFAQHDVRMEELRRTVLGALSQVHEALDPRQRRELADILERGWGGGHHGWHRRGCGRRHEWRGEHPRGDDPRMM